MSTLVALGCVLGLLLALTRRPLTALALTLYVAATLLIASFVKQSFLGMPMTLADVRFFLLRPAVNAEPKLVLDPQTSTDRSDALAA